MANVLFVCADNTCRSPIAEALARSLCDSRYEVVSAGVTPGREIHPLVRRVLAERGISADGLRPRPLRETVGRKPLDLAVILCEAPDDQHPATWPGGATRLIWPIPDPLKSGGSELERLAAFRRIRDDIEVHIRRWLADPDVAWA
jgi:arsenate reductase